MAKIRCLRRLNGRYREEVRELETICNSYDQTRGKVNLSTDMKAVQGFRSFYMYYEEDLLGFVEVNILDEEDVELYAFVHPEHRHRGIFKKLMDEVSKECKKFEIKELMIRHNPISDAAVPVLTAIHAEYSYSEYQLQQPVSRLGLNSENDNNNALDLVKLSTEEEEFYIKALMYVFDFDMDFARERYEEALRDRHITTFIAFENGKRIGFFSLYFSGSTYTIYDFGILNEFQLKGYGKKLLLALYEKVRRNGNHRAVRLILQVGSLNKVAFEMYRKYGFEIEEQLDYYKLNLN